MRDQRGGMSRSGRCGGAAAGALKVTRGTTHSLCSRVRGSPQRAARSTRAMRASSSPSANSCCHAGSAPHSWTCGPTFDQLERDAFDQVGRDAFDQRADPSQKAAPTTAPPGGASARARREERGSAGAEGAYLAVDSASRPLHRRRGGRRCAVPRDARDLARGRARRARARRREHGAARLQRVHAKTRARQRLEQVLAVLPQRERAARGEGRGVSN